MGSTAACSYRYVWLKVLFHSFPSGKSEFVNCVIDVFLMARQSRVSFIAVLFSVWVLESLEFW